MINIISDPHDEVEHIMATPWSTDTPILSGQYCYKDNTNIQPITVDIKVNKAEDNDGKPIHPITVIHFPGGFVSQVDEQFIGWYKPQYMKL